MIKIPVIKKLFKTKKSTMEMSESEKEVLNYNETLFETLFEKREEIYGKPLKWIKASDIKPDDEWMQEDAWDEIYKKEDEQNLDMKQESILDKVRTEIVELDIYYDTDYYSDNKDAMFKCNDVLHILDEYKAESEE